MINIFAAISVENSKFFFLKIVCFIVIIHIFFQGNICWWCLDNDVIVKNISHGDIDSPSAVQLLIHHETQAISIKKELTLRRKIKKLEEKLKRKAVKISNMIEFTLLTILSIVMKVWIEIKIVILILFLFYYALFPLTGAVSCRRKWDILIWI